MIGQCVVECNAQVHVYGDRGAFIRMFLSVFERSVFE